jgi:V8-like Glu-specific endopeptidase
MVELSTADRRRVVDILASIPELSTASSRQVMLDLAGLSKLAPHIDLAGPTFIAVNNIVSFLSHYGRMTWDHEALGLFLNLIKDLCGLEQQQALAAILQRYDLMTPVSPLPPVTVPTTQPVTADLLEKVFTPNTLRPIAFIELALLASRSVAFLSVTGRSQRWTGTGFMVSADLLITNCHVLPGEKEAAGAVYTFNYENTPAGSPRQTEDYLATNPAVFWSNSELDYAVVQLGGKPGDTWGFLRLSDSSPAVGERVNIIQHPGGQPKQIALQSNFVEYCDKTVIQYLTSTLPGSSGSPVFADDWRVCAVHHAGGRIVEPGTKRSVFRNEGISIGRILQDLPAPIRDRIIG